jgi:hypothetical protein
LVCELSLSSRELWLFSLKKRGEEKKKKRKKKKKRREKEEEKIKERRTLFPLSLVHE